MKVQRNILVDHDTWNKLKILSLRDNLNVRELSGDIIQEFVNKSYKESDKKKNLKAIIIAAGTGGRMKHLTQDKPKCMLDLGGTTMLQMAVDTFRECGIKDIVVVIGHAKDKIDIHGIEKVENTDYMNNNILASLMYAKHKMDTPFIACYSDIIFDRSVVEKLIESPADISVVIDTDWAKAYEGREQHPVEEAENVIVKNGKVVRISKIINPNEATGEFIGMAKFSKTGASILKSVHDKARQKYGDKPFHTAKSFKNAYLTDMFQELINRGYSVIPVHIQGRWMEVDTEEDFEKAKQKYSS